MSTREGEVSDKDAKCMEDLQTWQNDLNRLGEGGFRDRSYAYESESRLHKYYATLGYQLYQSLHSART